MTEIEVTEEVAGSLPVFMPNADTSGNFKLLRGIGRELDKADRDIKLIGDANTVQKISGPTLTVEPNQTFTVRAPEVYYYDEVEVYGTLDVQGTLHTPVLVTHGSGTTTGDGDLNVSDAWIVSTLSAMGEMVDLPPEKGESADRYRERLISRFALATNEGTINEFLQNAAEILDTSPSVLDYSEPSGGENGTASLTIPGAVLSDSGLDEASVADVLGDLLAASYRLDASTKGTFTYITPSNYNNNNHDASKGYDGLDGNGDPKDNGGTYAGLIT